ncbi:MAG: cyclic nucleotide-binding domain-containing protein, partial [Myxococcota bacterium]
LTIEDLVALERWDEAIARLQGRVEVNANDLHAHLKLAECYVGAGRNTAALDEFFFVSDSYCDDGFYDKAIALLSKIARLAPGDSQFEGRLRRAQQLKDLEHRRTLAMEGLMAAQEEKDPLARLSLIEAQILWRGIQSSDFVSRLSGEQLRRLFESSVLSEPQRGTILAERGSQVEQLYIFASGAAEALCDLGDGHPVHLKSFEAGDIIGDRSLFEHQPWPATYRTTVAGQLFRLDPAGLEKALLGNADPRALIDALRARRSDHDVAAAVRKLVASPA